MSKDLLSVEYSNADWQALHLKCAITNQALSDPSLLLGCQHLAMVNFDALHSFVSAHRACPIPGCHATGIRGMRKSIVRDERLKEQVTI